MRARGLKLTTDGKNDGIRPSRPMRARGLKPPFLWFVYYYTIAPHAGAWIETVVHLTCLRVTVIAPHAGAWIETKKQQQTSLT